MEAGTAADLDEVSLDVPPGDARSARRFIAVVLVRWQLTSASKLIVMVGHELVANALRHGTPPARLLLRRRTDGVRIEVGDASSDVPRMPEIDNTTSTSGRGLRIVTSLARDWGVRVTKGGKVVWADIAVTTAAANLAVTTAAANIAVTTAAANLAVTTAAADIAVARDI